MTLLGPMQFQRFWAVDETYPSIEAYVDDHVSVFGVTRRGNGAEVGIAPTVRGRSVALAELRAGLAQAALLLRRWLDEPGVEAIVEQDLAGTSEPRGGRPTVPRRSEWHRARNGVVSLLVDGVAVVSLSAGSEQLVVTFEGMATLGYDEFIAELNEGEQFLQQAR